MAVTHLHSEPWAIQSGVNSGCSAMAESLINCIGSSIEMSSLVGWRSIFVENCEDPIYVITAISAYSVGRADPQPSQLTGSCVIASGAKQSRGNDGTLATTRLLRRFAPRNDGQTCDYRPGTQFKRRDRLRQN